MKPTKKLIQETKAINWLNQLQRQEIGLIEELSAKQLKQLLYTFKTNKKT